jgi:hypothetical protein
MATTSLPLVVLMTILSSAGASMRVMQVVGIVTFTTAFTIHDVVLREEDVPLARFVRKSLAGNLLFVVLWAIVLAALLPQREEREGSIGRSEPGRAVAPPSEDAGRVG